jgi:hypothetical protein
VGRRDDDETERRQKLELTGAVVDRSSAREQNWVGL